MCCLAVAEVAFSDIPRYVFFNQAPGVAWHQDRPESFTRAGFDEIAETLRAPENPELRIGVSFFFSILEGDPNALAESVRALLRASEESGVPVLVILDGQQWWESRADLWNWWDSSKPGYDPKHANNVEWTGWDASCALKIAWRNWGSQLRVAPPPNIASPAFLDANRERLDRVAPIVAAWYRGLTDEKKYLFGGVKVGNEVGIGYNAFYYPDGNHYLEQWPGDASHDPRSGLDLSKGLSGGLPQLGYAAVKTAGLKNEGVVARDDLGRVTQRYLAMMAERVHAAGIPAPLIFAHQGGTYPPWGTHLPFEAALTECSTPGWSFYGLDPAACAGIDAALDTTRGRWCAAEWWWGAPDKAGWLDHFKRTLKFRDCRFVDVYNWNCGFSFKNETAGQEAVRELVAHWKD